MKIYLSRNQITYQKIHINRTLAILISPCATGFKLGSAPANT